MPELHYQKADGSEQNPCYGGRGRFRFHRCERLVQRESAGRRGSRGGEVLLSPMARTRTVRTVTGGTSRRSATPWSTYATAPWAVACHMRAYTGQHAGQTKVTVNFKPTDSVGERATGVQVWTDDQMKSTYLPFNATGNGFGKIAQGYVDGAQSQVNSASSTAKRPMKHPREPKTATWRAHGNSTNSPTRTLTAPSRHGWTATSRRPSPTGLQRRRRRPPRRSRTTSRTRKP